MGTFRRGNRQSTKSVGADAVIGMADSRISPGMRIASASAICRPTPEECERGPVQTNEDLAWPGFFNWQLHDFGLDTWWVSIHNCPIGISRFCRRRHDGRDNGLFASISSLLLISATSQNAIKTEPSCLQRMASYFRACLLRPTSSRCLPWISAQGRDSHAMPAPSEPYR